MAHELIFRKFLIDEIQLCNRISHISLLVHIYKLQSKIYIYVKYTNPLLLVLTTSTYKLQENLEEKWIENYVGMLLLLVRKLSVICNPANNLQLSLSQTHTHTQ